MFSHLLSCEKVQELVDTEYTMYHVFMLNKEFSKNNVRVDRIREVFYINNICFENESLDHYIDKWLCESIFQLKDDERKLLLHRTENFTKLFLFIKRYQTNFEYELERVVENKDEDEEDKEDENKDEEEDEDENEKDLVEKLIVLAST
jgi:hypothetical protein